MARKQKAYKREKRKQQVMAQLKIWFENNYATEATSYKLAKALEITPSMHFIGILNEMVADGDLMVDERSQFGRFDTKFYYLSPSREHYHEKYGKRRINVKRKGVVSAQLEMWS